jgi:predicted RNA-binding protein with PUA-like domain
MSRESAILAATMARARQSWLIKSEPFKYPFDQLVADGRTTWDGVRNFEARNNLRAMKKGDRCLFYHSNEGKAVVGLAKVSREAYQDPTTKDDWSAVDVAPVRALRHPVTLDAMRGHPLLKTMMIFRRSRLSVVPVTEDELEAVLALGRQGVSST